MWAVGAAILFLTTPPGRQLSSPPTLPSRRTVSERNVATISKPVRFAANGLDFFHVRRSPGREGTCNSNRFRRRFSRLRERCCLACIQPARAAIRPPLAKRLPNLSLVSILTSGGPAMPPTIREGLHPAATALRRMRIWAYLLTVVLPAVIGRRFAEAKVTLHFLFPLW